MAISSDELKNAIMRWQGSSTTINNLLFNQSFTTILPKDKNIENLKAYVNDAITIFENMKEVENDMSVYRGQDVYKSKELLKSLPTQELIANGGQELTLQGLPPTSLNKDEAVRFTQYKYSREAGIVFNISLPKGSRYIEVADVRKGFEHEQEQILPPAVYEIQSIEYDKTVKEYGRDAKCIEITLKPKEILNIYELLASSVEKLKETTELDKNELDNMIADIRTKETKSTIQKQNGEQTGQSPLIQNDSYIQKVSVNSFISEIKHEIDGSWSANMRGSVKLQRELYEFLQDLELDKHENSQIVLDDVKDQRTHINDCYKSYEKLASDLQKLHEKIEQSSLGLEIVELKSFSEIQQQLERRGVNFPISTDMLKAHLASFDQMIKIELFDKNFYDQSLTMDENVIALMQSNLSEEQRKALFSAMESFKEVHFRDYTYQRDNLIINDMLTQIQLAKKELDIGHIDQVTFQERINACNTKIKEIKNLRKEADPLNCLSSAEQKLSDDLAYLRDIEQVGMIHSTRTRQAMFSRDYNRPDFVKCDRYIVNFREVFKTSEKTIPTTNPTTLTSPASSTISDEENIVEQR
ncbi:MAG: hypothetical protein FWE45_03620 [Firmicutes bacterium]|nr:hypothetical protein [Bacillota bacterium]